MDEYRMQAFEALGRWQITMSRRYRRDDGEMDTDLLYRGDHVPIDEEDPLIRAMLLLSQVERDLNRAYRGEIDTLSPRAMEH